MPKKKNKTAARREALSSRVDEARALARSRERIATEPPTSHFVHDPAVRLVSVDPEPPSPLSLAVAEDVASLAESARTTAEIARASAQTQLATLQVLGRLEATMALQLAKLEGRIAEADKALQERLDSLVGIQTHLAQHVIYGPPLDTRQDPGTHAFPEGYRRGDGVPPPV